MISEQDEIELGLRWEKCPWCGNSFCITILKEFPFLERRKISDDPSLGFSERS